MESLTKNKQDRHTIEQMVARCFAPVTMEEYQELTEGYFNVAYEVSLSSQEKVILKVAPLAETRIMTYEKNIMFSEVRAMKMAGKSGKSLHTVKDDIPPEQLTDIYKKVGEINCKINEIQCPCFGYPGQPAFQGKEWYPVFRRMLEAGVEDAKRGGVDLQIPVDIMWTRLEGDRKIFNEVTEARLVHWDCWDGNIFVEDGRVTGIIDWERSLWGDPLMEVGFRTYQDNTLFQKGYGINALTENQKRRALWYDIYFMILAALECEYRRYETMDMYNWSTQILRKQFQKL